MKVPPKIKVLMWFFHRKVIITKDNPVKRNWEGHTMCCFVEKRNHSTLFCEYLLSKTVWRIVHMTFGLAPPKNIKTLFGNWLKGIPNKDLIQIRVGVCIVLWAL
jgi:hypothetical protein